MTRGESLFEDVNLLCLRGTITAVHVKRSDGGYRREEAGEKEYVQIV